MKPDGLVSNDGTVEEAPKLKEAAGWVGADPNTGADSGLDGAAKLNGG